MSSQIQLKVEEINNLRPLQVVENPKVEQKFVQMYDKIWGKDLGEQIYNKEKFNFNKILTETPALQECTPLSLYGCFLDIAVSGLSLDQTGRPQCYIMTRNVKVKTGNTERWEKRANIQVSAYGEIYMRQRAGQIRYCDNPVVVYEGDIFSIGLENGVKKITYQAAIPRASNRIIAAFMRIVRNDGSEDYQWMLENDWQRLARYSDKNNKGKGANALYTSNNGQIDSGFLENKLMKHAFDTYPKVKTGNFTVMESEQEQEDEIDYGIIDTEAEVINANESFDEPTAIEQAPTVVYSVSQSDEEEGF